MDFMKCCSSLFLALFAFCYLKARASRVGSHIGLIHTLGPRRRYTEISWYLHAQHILPNRLSIESSDEESGVVVVKLFARPAPVGPIYGRQFSWQRFLFSERFGARRKRIFEHYVFRRPTI